MERGALLLMKHLILVLFGLMLSSESHAFQCAYSMCNTTNGGAILAGTCNLGSGNTPAGCAMCICTGNGPGDYNCDESACTGTTTTSSSSSSTTSSSTGSGYCDVSQVGRGCYNGVHCCMCPPAGPTTWYCTTKKEWVVSDAGTCAGHVDGYLLETHSTRTSDISTGPNSTSCSSSMGGNGTVETTICCNTSGYASCGAPSGSTSTASTGSTTVASTVTTTIAIISPPPPPSGFAPTPLPPPPSGSSTTGGSTPFSGSYNTNQSCTIADAVPVEANGQCRGEYTKIRNYCAQMGAPGQFVCKPAGKVNSVTGKKDRARVQ